MQAAWEQAVSDTENRHANGAASFGSPKLALGAGARGLPPRAASLGDEACGADAVGERRPALARRSEPGPGSADAGGPRCLPKKTAWLSALVAETPPRRVDPGPKIVLQNQFVADAATPGRVPSPARRALSPAPDAATPPPADCAEGAAPLCLAQPWDRHAGSPDASEGCSSMSDAATSATSPRPVLSPHRDVSGDDTARTPSSGGLSDSAARKWLNSSRGDWYSSSARAKVAASSMGFSPMPLEELLTLPVPPLFLAVDEQEKRRSTRREDLGAHDASRDPAAAQGMLRASPLAPTQPHLPPLRQLPTPDDAGRFRNDFAERPDTIWRGPAAAAPQRQSCDDMLSPDASHSTIAADDRDGHNDFAAVRAAQAVTPATERSPQDLHARPRVLAYRSAMPSALSPACSPDAEKSDAAETLGVSEDRSESEVVMGCLRMSAPPSLGFLLGGAGALRTDAPTPALARKAAPANNGAHWRVQMAWKEWDTWERQKEGGRQRPGDTAVGGDQTCSNSTTLCSGVPGDDELQEIDPLEASMLLDKLFKKKAFQPQPTRAAAPAPWTTAPPGAGLLAEAAGHAGREGVGGMIQEANEEIAADIARRCVFDTSPPANDKRVGHSACVLGGVNVSGARQGCWGCESF